MFKGLSTVLGLLLVVVVLWIGLGLYFSSTEAEINPNADSYIAPINPEFQTDGFDVLRQRVDQNLPVSPETFRALVESD